MDRLIDIQTNKQTHTDKNAYDANSKGDEQAGRPIDGPKKKQTDMQVENCWREKSRGTKYFYKYYLTPWLCVRGRITSAPSLEDVSPNELFATHLYSPESSSLFCKRRTREEMLPFWITVPPVTVELFFSQLITGRGYPLASQVKITVIALSSRYTETFFGWSSMVGSENTVKIESTLSDLPCCRI